MKQLCRGFTLMLNRDKIKFMSNYTRLFLNGFNYIFVTIVTNERQKILIENIDI